LQFQIVHKARLDGQANSVSIHLQFFFTIFLKQYLVFLAGYILAGNILAGNVLAGNILAGNILVGNIFASNCFGW
jgi:hypothetical protein